MKFSINFLVQKFFDSFALKVFFGNISITSKKSKKCVDNFYNFICAISITFFVFQIQFRKICKIFDNFFKNIFDNFFLCLLKLLKLEEHLKFVVILKIFSFKNKFSITFLKKVVFCLLKPFKLEEHLKFVVILKIFSFKNNLFFPICFPVKWVLADSRWLQRKQANG